MSNQVGTSGATLAGAMTISLAASSLYGVATADAAINPLRSRQKASQNITKVATKIARTRHKCAKKIQKGSLAWTVNCDANTVAMGGPGTGSLDRDAKIDKAWAKWDGGYMKQRLQGDPATHGVSGLCSPPSNDWGSLDICVGDLIKAASVNLHGPRWNGTMRLVGDTELSCRNRVGKVTRNAYTKLVKHRSKCFIPSGLLGNGV